MKRFLKSLLTSIPWLDRCANPRHARVSRPRAQLRLEVLETRDLPAVSFDLGFGLWGGTWAAFNKPAGATAVAIQPSDNKIVAAGMTLDAQGSIDFALARFLPNGVPDNSFNYDGKAVTSFFGLASVAIPEAVAIQYDGKIVVAGVAFTGPVAHKLYPTYIALARYLPDGELDPSFGQDPTHPGMVVSWFQDSWGEEEASGALAMVLQNVGTKEKILVGGLAGDYDFGLARFNPDGSRDWGFGSPATPGEAVTGFPRMAAVNALALDNHNGDIVAAGVVGISSLENDADPPNLAVALYHADGTPDTGFGSQGSVVLAQPSVAEAVAVDSSGNIVVGGASLHAGKPDQFLLARYLPNGSLDPNFQGSGLVFTDFGHDACVGAVFFQGGSIIAVGGSRVLAGPDVEFDLAAYLPNGDPDLTFGPGGTLPPDLQFPDSCQAYGAAMQADNAIVVAGTWAPEHYSPVFMVTRYVTGYPANQNQIDDGLNSNPVSGGYAPDLLTQYHGTNQLPTRMDSVLPLQPWDSANASSAGEDWVSLELARCLAGGLLPVQHDIRGQAAVSAAGLAPARRRRADRMLGLFDIDTVPTQYAYLESLQDGYGHAAG
jgi:uncharacterized delta-60 repeat protein